MATYRISNLIDKLAEIMNDGYEFVEISELEENDDFPACLNFNAVEYNNASVDYEEVDSVKVPENYSSEESSLYHVKVNCTL